MPERSFENGREAFSGGMRTTVADAPEAFALFADMLNRPTFDAAPLERMKAAQVTAIRDAETSPRGVLGKAMRETVFAGHPFEKGSRGTLESVAAIEPGDLIAAHKRVLARDNLIVGVVGAISPDELKTVLDQMFGDLPETADLRTVPPIPAVAEKQVHVELDVPQSNVAFVQDGLTRDDPDFYAAHLVDHILGGGAFSSRLFQEVREKRGLAYGAYSYIDPYKTGGLTGAGSATQTDRVGTTIKVIGDEIDRMAKDGPTAEELRKAKDYVIGSYAINNLDTSRKIANSLVAIQDAKLGKDYFTKRRDYLEAVTLEDAKRVAKRLYGGPKTLITVGRKPSEG